MKFEEIFKKYKMGTANEDEQTFVKEEMRKHELINQYQLDDFVRDENEELLDGTLKGDLEEVKSIKKTVNKKLAKVVAISVAIVFLIAGALNYVAIPLYDLSFYNPAKDFDPQNDADGKFQRDVNAFTELHYPGVLNVWGKIKHSGIATYDISFYRGDNFGYDEHFKTKMVRGKIVDRDDFLRGSYFTFKNSVFPIDKVNLDMTELEKLPKSSELKAYIQLQEAATIKTVSDLTIKHPDVKVNWIGIKVNDEIITKPNSKGERAGFLDFRGAGINLNCKEDVQNVEAHFKSLLRELTDAKDFLKSIDAEKLFISLSEKQLKKRRPFLTEEQYKMIHPSLTEVQYKDMLNYVEKNGVKPNCVLIQGNVDAITQLLKDETVTSIQIRDARLSELSGFDN